MPAVGRLRYLEGPPKGGHYVQGQGGRARDSSGTLVLLHAFPVTARMWEPQLALADGGWRVIAPQFRGMDGADRDPPATSLDDYAGDVVDLLDALHIDEAVIGGLSMGGYVTFALFRLAPRYFRGMVLADTRSQADTPEGVENRKRLLALVREKGPDAVAEAMLPKLLADTTLQRRPDVVAAVRALVLANSTEAIAGAVTALMTRPDSTPLLSQIHCPTLILVGDRDVVTPPAVGKDLQRAIAGSELTIIEDAGHLSNLEQPAAFNKSLARFLEHRV